MQAVTLSTWTEACFSLLPFVSQISAGNLTLRFHKKKFDYKHELRWEWQWCVWRFTNGEVQKADEKLDRLQGDDESDIDVSDFESES